MAQEGSQQSPSVLEKETKMNIHKNVNVLQGVFFDFNSKYKKKKAKPRKNVKSE